VLPVIILLMVHHSPAAAHHNEGFDEFAHVRDFLFRQEMG